MRVFVRASQLSDNNGLQGVLECEVVKFDFRERKATLKLPDGHISTDLVCVCMPGTSFIFLVSRRLLELLSRSMAAKYVPDNTMQKIVDDAHSELQRYGVWNELYFDSEEEMLDKIDYAFWKEIEDAAVKNGVRYYSDINI